MKVGIFLLFCYFLACHLISGYCPENTIDSYESIPQLYTLHNTYLKGHTIKVILVSSILQCFFECISQEHCDCLSVNFERQANPEGLYLCDLKNQTKNTVNDSDMGRKVGVDYVDVQSHFMTKVSTNPYVSLCSPIVASNHVYLTFITFTSTSHTSI